MVMFKRVSGLPAGAHAVVCGREAAENILETLGRSPFVGELRQLVVALPPTGGALYLAEAESASWLRGPEVYMVRLLGPGVARRLFREALNSEINRLDDQVSELEERLRALRGIDQHLFGEEEVESDGEDED